MEDVRGMHVLESTKTLPHEVLDMLLGQTVVTVDDPMQIGVHVLEHEIDVTEIVFDRWLDQIPETDDVLMTHVTEDLRLPQNSFPVHEIIEGVRNLFDRDSVTLLEILRTAHHSIGTSSDELDRNILRVHDELGTLDQKGMHRTQAWRQR